MRTPSPLQSHFGNTACVLARWATMALFCAGLMPVLAGTAAAAQQGALTLQLNLAQMVEQSQFVVLGRVTAVKAEPHPQYTNLDTVVVTLQVLDPIKGSPGAELTFRQYVFDVNDRNTKLGYRIGEEVALLLRTPSAQGLTSPVGFEQGRFHVERDSANNRVLRNGTDNAALFSGLDQTAPNLKGRLSSSVQRMVAEHQSGPISYADFKSFVQSALANGQPAQ